MGNKYFIKFILLGLSLLLSFGLYSQNAVYKAGIEQGVVYVKFAPTMAKTLSTSKINTKKSKVATGIKTFDKTASIFNATNMERVFPANAQNEEKLKKHGLDLWYVIKINDKVDPKIAVNALNDLEEISIAECSYQKVLPKYTVTEQDVTNINTNAKMPFNDPMLKDQWHYKNTNQLGISSTRLADINLFEAWELTAGSSNIVVSVHDEGVDIYHEDLRDNIWVNTKEIPNNGIDDDNNGYIDDVNGFDFKTNTGNLPGESHGTHVAGTISAVNNNGIGVAGVAGGSGKSDGVKIMSLRILGNSGGYANIAKTYVYAADNGAVISQNSWGYTDPDALETHVLDAIDYFIAEAGKYAGSPMKGGVVIFSAGNETSDRLYYPAAYKNCISVASVAPDWKIASYSNYGSTVEISAPGGDQNRFGTQAGVLSTLPNDKYGKMQGTSMACPHVSGVAALILANSPTQITSKVLKERLLAGVTNVYEYNETYIGKMGTGAIDAKLAMGGKANNYPPVFVDAPSKVSVNEKQTVDINIKLEDREGDEITISANLPSFITQEFKNNNLKLTLKPQIKDVGTHNILIKATDSRNLSSYLNLSVQVIISNRPPVFIGVKNLEFNVSSAEEVFNINNFFKDYDNDVISFSLSLDKEGIVSLSKSTSLFEIKPLSAGNVTLTINADDGYNETVSEDINITVKDCLKNIIVQKWNKVLVADAVTSYKILGYQWYKNGKPLSGETKKYYAAGGDGSEQLEKGAEYTVKIISAKEIYSCPHIRKDTKVSLRAYPNPVQRGQTVTVETYLKDYNNSPITIKVFNLSGQLINTINANSEETNIKMPDASGYYLIKVTSNQIDKTFKILVE